MDMLAAYGLDLSQMESKIKEVAPLEKLKDAMVDEGNEDLIVEWMITMLILLVKVNFMTNSQY